MVILICLTLAIPVEFVLLTIEGMVPDQTGMPVEFVENSDGVEIFRGVSILGKQSAQFIGKHVSV